MSDVVTSDPKRSLPWRLYHGETSFDFVGQRRKWFMISGAVILIGLLALGAKSLNFGIEFKGGTSWLVPANGVTVSQTRSALTKAGYPDATVQTITSGGATNLRIQSSLTGPKVGDVTKALAVLTKTDSNSVNVNSVGASWGHNITAAAERALFFFLAAIFAFIWIRFSEWKMSVAALIALVHDLLVTVGIYAVFGFPVTPATVVALLTILGYSLYDTVVVFDKIDENTKGLASSGRLTYSDTVNLSMNQVLMRSLNTSLVAILPILSVLVVGSVLLGATTLREFGLALFVGLLTGAYSSIFIAAPVLAVLKEREPRYSTIRQRLESRGAAGALLTPAAAAAQRGTGRPAARSTRDADAVDAVDDDADNLAASAVSRGAVRSRPATARPRPASTRQAPRGRKKGKRR